MKKLTFAILVAVAALGFSCTATNTNNTPAPVNDSKSKSGVANPPVEAAKTTETACPPNLKGEAKILASQTFKMDFEPFKGGCFVTTYTSGDEKRPAGSVIAIYKSGEKAFEFDTRYHKDQGVCRVEAVSFEDANNDGRSDVTVVGKCDTKSGEVQGNEIHFNTGSGFRTSTAANDKLENITTAKEVVEFARTNPRIFN